MTTTNTEKSRRENFETCKRIAEELDAIANGNMVKCPECGEIFDIYDEMFGGYSIDENDQEKCTCPNCGATEYDRGEVFEDFTLLDYFESALDIEYICASRNEYRGVRVMVTCGGPNIYVDTMSKKVEMYWWTETASALLSDEAVDAIDELFEELFLCS